MTHYALKEENVIAARILVCISGCTVTKDFNCDSARIAQYSCLVR